VKLNFLLQYSLQYASFNLLPENFHLKFPILTTVVVLSITSDFPCEINEEGESVRNPAKG
jgi:hypothetical protein